MRTTKLSSGELKLKPSLSTPMFVRCVALAAFVGLFIADRTSGQSAPPRRGRTQSLAEPPKRSRPPVWSVDVLDAFFPDARTALVGPRPDYGRVADAGTLPGAGKNPGGSPAARPQPHGDVATATWSQFVDAETIETEIKRLAQAVTLGVTAPGPFKGGGYQACRRQFSVLAVLFAVSGEYDGSVRWQNAAPALRDAFARAAKNLKVGSDQTYSEAVARKQDLEALVRGERPQLGAAERKAAWGQVSDRPPLMQRMNAANQERLSKWLANEREFTNNREEVRHEAQIIAMLADVIGREGFENWDDETYAGYAKQLRTAAGEVSAAVGTNNYTQARQALDRASKACADCHEGYRG